MLAMESRLEEQERTIIDCKNKVADLEQTVAELKLKQNPGAGLGQGDSNSGNNRIRAITRLDQSRQASTQTIRALLNADGPIAFHAVIKRGHVDHLGVNQNIVFPDILENLGGGYHNQHGVFIAPRPGVYIFSTTIIAQNFTGYNEIYVHLIKNDQILANAAAHAFTGGWDQGSVTVVTQLAAADEVSVSLYGPANASLYGDYYDSFMGCLVIPL